MDAKVKEIEARCERDAGMDWEQVRQNGGPPCFHTMKEGVLCGRAKQWFGHGKFGHEYMSLADLLRESAEREKKLVDALREIVKQYRNVRNAEGYPDPLPNSSLPTADALLALYPAPAKEESHD